MRVYVLGDVHLEFGNFDPPPVEADVVVLAGDTDRGLRGIAWARKSFPGKPVIYVIGNHEYYGKALPKLTVELRQQAGDGIHVLEQDIAEINGIRFLGCTLWTDFQLLGDPLSARLFAEEGMNDYRKIRVTPQYRRLRAADTEGIHQRSHRWLGDAIRKRLTRGAVIVTHHAPSARSLNPKITGDWLSAAYASALDPLVEASRAKLWIHGHTHRVSDYFIGETRVISNPRGYAVEPVPGFDPGLVVAL
jgi:predicted phosphohydrolase